MAPDDFSSPETLFRRGDAADNKKQPKEPRKRDDLHQSHPEQKNLVELQALLDPKSFGPFEGLNNSQLETVTKALLPTGLKSSKDLSLEKLQQIVRDFHANETRTDVLTQLPLDFEPEKSIFSFFYTMKSFKDPTVDLLECPVASTPTSPNDTPAGLVWECEAGNFCAAPNISVPCLPGFYCPENTAQPTLCCKGYLCSTDTKSIEVCPEGYFCPLASTRALPCNFLGFCPRGTSAIEKYGLGAVLLVFALFVMGMFAIKKRIVRAQHIRYSRRLRELGDNSAEIESEKRRKKEVAELAQSIIIEDRIRAASSRSRGGGGGGGGLEGAYDFAASQRSLALAAAAAGNMNASTMTLPRAERSFDICFENLGLTLPTGSDIIKNISGRLIAGRTCAVMGPSGAGKTTFLSILAGKVAKTDGIIKVNGKEQTLSLWKKLIGFVPQEDIMLSELTVREILMHSARMRQPVHMSHNEKRLKVLEVIQFLGIGHIMDNPIGDIETRGVSGGERKRVNIGMELVASPSILFLDEPTSGLDSATSLEVCKLLKQIAQEQFLTVAAIVHSPSPHAFNQFDDLLLLGAGGRVVYAGPREEAAHYFESIGYPVPDGESPADFFISLAAGRVEKASSASLGYFRRRGGDNSQERPHNDRRSPRSKSPKERVNELFVHWEQYSNDRDMSKAGRHAIHESDTMTTVHLSNYDSNQASPIKHDLAKQTGMHLDAHDHDYRLEEKRFGLTTAAALVEYNCHISTMALHQTSRPQSPTYSVPISTLEGSSSYTSCDSTEKSNKSLKKHGFLSSVHMSLISTWADIGYWCRDVADEFSHWLWSIKCKFTGEKDPVRETPSFGSVFILWRACLQNYRSQLDFLGDQALHLACGLCVSFASKDMLYIPRQPAEICAIAPPALQLTCATPFDDIGYVGMFMTLGIFFAGISVGTRTFGDEKAVFWRDSSAGMPTLPYYLAKILADVPRMIVATCMYTSSFIFFFAYNQKMTQLLALVLIIYINAFALGYFVSAAFNRSMLGLAGTGMSLTWALVFSGSSPRLYKVMTSPRYASVRWLWTVSAPRWAVEAFYLKEMEFRDYNELKHHLLVDTFSFDNYKKAISYMLYIALCWNLIVFMLMKLLNRHKVK
ncbi:hypothetical protein BX616_010139 [Lobosporangium transversale]|nr:hypothetical protein BX616_010139 [Lobosporangium transversale]